MTDTPYYRLHFGTQTVGSSAGVYRALLDTRTGMLSQPRMVAETSNPTFLAWHPKGHILYAANQNRTQAAAISVFADVANEPLLSPICQIELPDEASGPCHLAVDYTGSLLATANYTGGSVAWFRLDASGHPQKLSGIEVHTGSSSHPERQTYPHPHGITFSPNDRFALVPDLGTDRIAVYRHENGVLVLHEHEGLVPAGAGPRHAVFSPDGCHVYCINELDNTVTHFDWNAHDGSLIARQSISLFPEGDKAMGTAAELAFSPNGRFLFASNRGRNFIAVFEREIHEPREQQPCALPVRGSLKFHSSHSVPGLSPRSFALSPCGYWLVVAHQDSGTLAVFKCDPATGMLTAIDTLRSLDRPTCVLFDPPN